MLDRTSLGYLEKIRKKLWSRKKYGNVGLMVGKGKDSSVPKKSKKYSDLASLGD